MAATNPSTPKTPIEIWREISQMHLHIASALRELDELMAEWLLAQPDLSLRPPERAS